MVEERSGERGAKSELMTDRKVEDGVADERGFDGLAGKIQSATQAFRQDAPGIINRRVTERAWLTGYHIAEFEQGGKARATYGDGLLKRLSERLSESDFSLSSLKDYRSFDLLYPELSGEIAGYVLSRFGQGQSLAKSFAVDTIALLSQKDNLYASFSFNESVLREIAMARGEMERSFSNAGFWSSIGGDDGETIGKPRTGYFLEMFPPPNGGGWDDPEGDDYRANAYVRYRLYNFHNRKSQRRRRLKYAEAYYGKPQELGLIALTKRRYYQ